MDHTPKPVVLCILDGWGIGPTKADNAPHLARTPNFDRLMATCPNATLITHGRDAGLPNGQMGNSEVGHTNIGAGRVVAMDLGMIDLAIEDGSFFRNPALADFITTLKASGGRAHLAGLASPGGVHAHQSHIVAAATALTDAGLEVLIHAFTDGRDVAPRSAGAQIEALEAALPPGARIATLCGRYFAMDRDNRWDRVERAYRVIVEGVGTPQPDARTAIEAAHAADTTDEFIEPAAIGGYAGMRDGDGLVFVNFRADRAREILAAIGDPDFTAFDRGARPALSAMLAGHGGLFQDA